MKYIYLLLVAISLCACVNNTNFNPDKSWDVAYSKQVAKPGNLKSLIRPGVY